MKGYIITVNIHDDKATIWFKTNSGANEEITKPYRPDFYIKPINMDINELQRILEKHPNIYDLEIEFARENLGSNRDIEVLHVYVDSIKNYRDVLRQLSSFPCKIFNCDLAHRQKLMFNLGVPCLNPVKYDSSGKFTIIGELNLEPPPINYLTLNLHANSKSIYANPKVDPISKITLCTRRDIIVLDGCESEILVELEKAISDLDPDFIITPKSTIRYLKYRAEINNLKLNLGRKNLNDKNISFIGRVIVDPGYFEDYGLAGIAELCNYSMLPPDLAVNWPIGHLVDSRQCYEALKRNILLPIARNSNTDFRTLSKFHVVDHGGLTFNPQIGVYENVCQLDFDSQYPNIIVKYNISYETVIDAGKVLRDRKGFLAEITEYWLNRRLYLKKLAKNLSEGPFKTYADQKQKALKSVLVVVYGYSGCPWNRFGNVKCFEEINRISRTIIVKTLNMVEREGFKVIYADVDSIYVQKPGAKLSDYEYLRNLIESEVGLPISIENYFKYLAFIPQKTDPSLAATKRYYGITYDGKLVYKGIEARRYDYPEYIRKVQLKMIEKLLDANSLPVVRNNVGKVVSVLADAIKSLINGEVPVEELVIHRVLRKHPLEYKSKFPHVIAALQLINNGVRIGSRGVISYIFNRYDASNPFMRVKALELVDDGKYGVEKYIEMLISAVETILSPLRVSKEVIVGLLLKHLPDLKFYLPVKLVRTTSFALRGEGFEQRLCSWT